MEKKDSYLEENRWFITASKWKCFVNSPEDFFLKYVKEVEPLNDQEKKCFTIGTAIDDLISYWEDVFNKKYFIDQWYLKADLIEKLEDMWEDCTWMKVDDLKDKFYWDVSEKVRLTKTDWNNIFAYYNEFKRQKLFEMSWEYECQKTFIWSYKSLKLKGTLDRFMIAWEEWMIRDTKTTKWIDSFKWEWDKKLWYDVSMCFYWVLVYCATEKKSRLIFDVIQKTFPFTSRVFEIPQWRIEDVINNIKESLDTLDACMTAYEKTGDESVWKVRVPFENLAKCDMYPIMETAIQEEIELLQ